MVSNIALLNNQISGPYTKQNFITSINTTSAAEGDSYSSITFYYNGLSTLKNFVIIYIGSGTNGCYKEYNVIGCQKQKNRDLNLIIAATSSSLITWFKPPMSSSDGNHGGYYVDFSSNYLRIRPFQYDESNYFSDKLSDFISLAWD